MPMQRTMRAVAATPSLTGGEKMGRARPNRLFWAVENRTTHRFS